jgi:2-polyprenyl-3-methyl-5-hydroxy-6-metoxy-1,4-benzoquinol methylase
MKNLYERSNHEIEHGKYLAESGNPENIWYWGTAAGTVRAKRRGALLTEAAGMREGIQVLEIGCGTGLFTEIFAESGASILAVDISPELLEFAYERKMPSNVKLQVTRFEDCDLPGGYDAIVGSSVLHHLDIPIALKRMHEMLKPGGIIAFAEPNMLNPHVWLERNVEFIRKRLGASPDETAIVRWELAKLLKDLGFVNINIRNTDWLHPYTPAAFIKPVSRLGLLLERIPLIREFSGSVLISAKRPQ